MSEDLSLLDKFPFLEDALKLPNDEFNNLIKGFIKYSSYCDYALLPDKVSEWCQYLKCENSVCDYNRSLDTAQPRITTTSSILLTIPSYCFDLWHCPPPWFCEINYFSMGIFCFILCIIAFIINIFYIPSFTFYGHCHSTDIFITILASSDIFQIFFVIYLRCLPYVYKTHESQVLFYSKVIAKTIPIFSPLLSLFESMSSWMLCCLLFERYLFQRYGKHSQLIISTKVSIIIILIIFFSLLFFCFVKFFELECRNGTSNFSVVHLTKLGEMETYHDLITHWLKVPIEYFAPLLIYIILLAMMYTSFGEQGIISFQSKKDKENKEIIKNFIIVNETDRENRIMFSAVILSTFASISIFLSFLHHVLSTEARNLNPEHLNYLSFSCQLISIVFIHIKPYFYIYISPYYCRGIKSCFKQLLPNNDEEGAPIAMTFEQTIANQMRESISYRRSIWSENVKDPEWIFKLKVENNSDV